MGACRGAQRGMRRVVVYERQSGVCLFSETWGTWKGDQSRGKICGLVQFFFQLAREIDDDGQVSRVMFHDPVKLEKLRPTSYHSRFPTLTSRTTTRKKGSSESGAVDFSDGAGLSMTCAQKDRLVSAAFFEDDVDASVMQRITSLILEKFVERFPTQINAILPMCDDVARTPDCVVDEDKVMAPFASFAESVQEIRKSHFKV